MYDDLLEQLNQGSDLSLRDGQDIDDKNAEIETLRRSIEAVQRERQKLLVERDDLQRRVEKLEFDLHHEVTCDAEFVDGEVGCLECIRIESEQKREAHHEKG
jgi:septal ring factor EnvC (AmiA/AmiB activator)